MAYNKKVWEDRVSENPTRRILTNVATGAERVVDVARNEGEVSQQGDSFDAATMNDLEDRIEEGLKDAASVVTGTKEEIESMLAQGLLKDGQQVVIEDDYVEGETIDELSDRVDALSENLAKLVDVTFSESNKVDLSQYSSKSNPFTAPCDGYVSISSTNTTIVFVNGIQMFYNAPNYLNSMFVKKGFDIHWEGSGLQMFRFIPLNPSV